MKTEILPNKMPDGFGPSGLPIDKSANLERNGVRIGMNLTVMVDSPIAQNIAYPHVIIWNTLTGERIKVTLDEQTGAVGEVGRLISGFRF